MTMLHIFKYSVDYLYGHIGPSTQYVIKLVRKFIIYNLLTRTPTYMKIQTMKYKGGLEYGKWLTPPPPRQNFWKYNRFYASSIKVYHKVLTNQVIKCKFHTKILTFMGEGGKLSPPMDLEATVFFEEPQDRQIHQTNRHDKIIYVTQLPNNVNY